MNKTIIIFFLVFICIILIYLWSIDIEVHIIDSINPGPTILFIGGTHGNEPAGTLALEILLNDIKKINRGKIIVIPRANKFGLLLGTRYLFNIPGKYDLNRNYPKENGEMANDSISRKIMNYVNMSDFVIDFHEGWGFHKINKESMGSGIYPNSTQISRKHATNILMLLNNNIIEPEKKFIMDYNQSDNMNTLSNYCKYKNKNYILIETTGQNDIQPKHIRINQNLTIINYMINQNNI